MTLPARRRATDVPVLRSPGVREGRSSSSGFLDVRPNVVSVFLPPHSEPWRSSTVSDQFLPLFPRLSFFVAILPAHAWGFRRLAVLHCRVRGLAAFLDLLRRGLLAGGRVDPAHA